MSEFLHDAATCAAAYLDSLATRREKRRSDAARRQGCRRDASGRHTLNYTLESARQPRRTCCAEESPGSTGQGAR
jgi:hypothetical protein